MHELQNNTYNSLKPELLQEYNRFRPMGPRELFCYVPFNGMTFCVNGEVYACSYNRKALLGRYPNQSLQEIWNSETSRKLRDFHRHNDLTFGCGHCQYFAEKKRFADLKPLTFDQFAHEPGVTRHYPRVVEFEISNICNLECQMCSGDNSSSIRKNRDKLPPLRNYYDGEFLEQLKEFIPYLKEARFMGGEPFLIPMHFDIWEAMNSMNPNMEIFIVTNGTQWSDRIDKLLDKGRFSISVSIDSLEPGKLSRIRKHLEPETFFRNIDRFRDKCASNGTNLSLSFTIQKDNVKELPDMMEYCNTLGARIFVSYLEHPVRFAVSDLSTETLQEVVSGISGREFPDTTDNQRHNRQCYMAYLDFLRELILAKQDKDNHQYQDLNAFEVVLDAPGRVLSAIRVYTASKNFREVDGDPIDNKIHALEEALSKEQLTRLYSLLLPMPVSEVYVLFKRMSSKELLKRSLEALENYRFR